MEYVKDNPAATQKEIAKAVELSLKSVENTFSLLKEKGLIKREGARKNGKWAVIEQ